MKQCFKCKAIDGDWVVYDASGWYMRADGGDVFDRDGNQHGRARGSEWPAVRDVLVMVRRDGLCRVCHARMNPRKRTAPKGQGALFIQPEGKGSPNARK